MRHAHVDEWPINSSCRAFVLKSDDRQLQQTCWSEFSFVGVSGVDTLYWSLL